MITLFIIFVILLIGAIITLMTCGTGLLMLVFLFGDIIFAIWIIVKLIKLIGKH